ncbi:glycosyltransferase family 17 protein [Chaetomium strumarium]|uniref:Glycosyltransferase family 17 protein n=1 Tax=Chaetomium strumarium TaxID=1170767 RepID=A0AAJ0M6E7_9PEZI|nr:glycosyltransferase family 17 protein [Chaetomium strumarium]
MLFLSKQLWRWIQVAAVLCIFWLVLNTARNNNSATPATHRSAADGQLDVCRPHGWKPFRPRSPDRARKVYDLVMINSELDMLEVRLNTTFDEVDYFVLVESRKTFTNLDKPLVLKKNLARFEPYLRKIIYHEIEYPPNFKPQRTWDMEDHQRNSMLTQVFPRLRGAQAPQRYDVIVVSDVDEIPRPSTLALLRACRFPRRLTLRSRFYYYSFQWLHRGPEWPHPQATYYLGAHWTLLPNDLRIADGGMWPFREWEKGELANASWHCSSCFATTSEFLGKMASFSHTWMNKEEYRDRNRILDRVRNGKDLWDREGEVYDRVEDNQDVPSFLLENQERFAYMLDRDGRNAGFEDIIFVDI